MSDLHDHVTAPTAPDHDLARMTSLVHREQRFTERHPAFFGLAVLLHRTRRRWAWTVSRTAWATTRSAEPLPVRVKRHKSLLVRTTAPDDAEGAALQRGKVVNLRLASARLDGLLVRPGETVSFNRLVGSCTRRRGYVDGMRLSNGEALAGVGGGICQLANLLVWMVMHSPLTVVERSEHSFDPFPDDGRVLPWGVGCSIVYNYVDLVVRNDTDLTFRLEVRVGERHLEGELQGSATPAHSYSVHEREAQFLRLGDEHFRRNEIWRDVVDRRTGRTVGSELLRRNCALVKYVPDAALVVDVTPAAGAPAVVADPRRA